MFCYLLKAKVYKDDMSAHNLKQLERNKGLWQKIW
jgi:hypothetical protein